MAAPGMSDQEVSPPRPSSERRRNAALRALVDEMLASIRVAANRELWTPEERARYEQELAAIMSRVRGQAVQRDLLPVEGGAEASTARPGGAPAGEGGAGVDGGGPA